ncbi:MAG TPA: suppressor of fused domain protein [Pseudonocardiaceae bacterium]|jgi:hypothetical protein|nr:suppressor of fused domain protein [Pseudonocardiaceae bacterium]
MTTTERFGRFADHVTTYLGAVERVESAETAEGNRGYDLLFVRHSEMEVASVVSNGLRFQNLVGDVPEELACSVGTPQVEAAHYLVDTVAQMVLDNEAVLEYGRVIPSPDPLLPGTNIQGVVAMAHPYAPDEFDLMRNEAGEVELQFVTLVPITKAESELGQAEGIQVLYGKWQEAGTDLLDITRESAV